MTAAIIVLYVVCSALVLAVFALAAYCNHLAQRHNDLNNAFIDYAEGVTKVFASLRVISVRELKPEQDVYTVEAPKGIQ